jgi:hypothetical protein
MANVLFIELTNRVGDVEKGGLLVREILDEKARLVFRPEEIRKLLDEITGRLTAGNVVQNVNAKAKAEGSGKFGIVARQHRVKPAALKGMAQPKRRTDTVQIVAVYAPPDADWPITHSDTDRTHGDKGYATRSYGELRVMLSYI